IPQRPSTKGSSITSRNWLVSWNPTFCAPVAASPSSWSRAAIRLAPVRLKSDRKAGGSAPPLLKELSIAWPTLTSLAVKAGNGGAAGWSGKGTGPPGIGCPPGIGGCPPRWLRRPFGNELRPDAKQYGIAGIEQSRCEVGRQAHGEEPVERAGDPARGRQNRVEARGVTAWREVGHCGAGKRGGDGHIGGRSRRGIDLDDV